MRAKGRLPVPVEEWISLHYAEVPAQPWPALAQAWLPRLPEPKRASILRLRQPADRNASLLGVALLGAALAERALAFEPADLAYAPRAKPRLAAGPDFSIAHAAGYVGCALATSGSVGFDLEAAGAVTAATLRLALGADEHARVAGGEVEATAAWVMTEAVLKAAGRGVDAATRVRLAGRGATLDGARYALAAATLEPALVAWIAHEGTVLALRCVRHGAGEFAPLP
jgi:4'-phosphopantetheinyl transferase